MATPRELARTRTMADITRLGREHLATYGAAGLSLRAIARDLGVVSSAVYRYVPSRDDLLTLLVVDAYTEFGRAVTAAEAAVPRADLAGRWRALAGAVREWALAEPSRYGLVFGSPVPGYHAPAEQTTGPGTVVVALLMRLAADAQPGGDDGVPASPHADDGVPASLHADDGVPASLHADAERARAAFDLPIADSALVAATLTWVSLFGAVSFEVFGQYGADTFTDPAVLFAALVGRLGAVLGVNQAGQGDVR